MNGPYNQDLELVLVLGVLVWLLLLLFGLCEVVIKSARNRRRNR